MQKDSDFNLKSVIWLTSSTLFLVGLIFGVVETSVITVFYKHLPFSSLLERFLFFTFCVLVYPVIFGLIGIPLGAVSYFLSRGFRETPKRISPERFLVACYLCIGIFVLIGIRLEDIVSYYRRSVSLYESIAGLLAILPVAIFASIIGFFLYKLLENLPNKVSISVCFIASILFVGIIYSFVKISEDVVRAEGTLKSIEKVSSVEVSPPLNLRKTNIVLISIDTLRADHLSSYGYGRKTSPNIDSLANKGILFTGAKTQKTSTAPSLASVLTGTYPNRHRVNKNGVTLRDFNITLAETLKKYGYKTAAFQSNLTAGIRFGFKQGFDYFGEWSDVARDELYESRELNKKIIPWLRENSEQRFFLWIHYRDPHTPYVVPPEYEKLYINDEMYGKYRDKKLEIGDSPFGEIKHEAVLNGSTDIDYYISQYDAEIKFNDDSIDELFRVFEQLKLFQNTLIIFTSDHGESLGEHNYYFSHGEYTYESTAWVPLIIYHPFLPKGRIINNIVELIDIYPTIMDFIGLSAEPQVQGKSLLPLIHNSSYASEFEYARIVGSWNFGYETHAIQNKRWKLIYDVNEYWVYFDRIVEDRVRFWKQKKNINPYWCRVFRTELYDLENDPGETKNLSSSGLPVEDKLRTLLFEWIDSGNYTIDPKETYDEEKLDKDTLEQLKALGYVN